MKMLLRETDLSKTVKSEGLQHILLTVFVWLNRENNETKVSYSVHSFTNRNLEKSFDIYSDALEYYNSIK